MKLTFKVTSNENRSIISLIKKIDKVPCKIYYDLESSIIVAWCDEEMVINEVIDLIESLYTIKALEIDNLGEILRTPNEEATAKTENYVADHDGESESDDEEEPESDDEEEPESDDEEEPESDDEGEPESDDEEEPESDDEEETESDDEEESESDDEEEPESDDEEEPEPDDEEEPESDGNEEPEPDDTREIQLVSKKRKLNYSPKPGTGEAAVYEFFSSAIYNLDSKKSISKCAISFLNDLGMDCKDKIFVEAFSTAPYVDSITYESIAERISETVGRKNQTVVLHLKMMFQRWLKSQFELKEEYPRISLVSFLKVFAKEIS